MISPKIMRQVWLICCLACYVAMQYFWLAIGHVGFFWAFVCIVAAVLIWEVINVKALYGKTLSTQTTDAIENSKTRIKAYLAGLFMCLAIFFLYLHLVWH
jgi:hypothetical protein